MIRVKFLKYWCCQNCGARRETNLLDSMNYSPDALFLRQQVERYHERQIKLDNTQCDAPNLILYCETVYADTVVNFDKMRQD